MSRNISLRSVIIIIKNIQIQFDRRKRERGAHLFGRFQLTKLRRLPTFEYQKADVYLTHGELVSAQLWKEEIIARSPDVVQSISLDREERILPSFLGIKRSNIFFACKGQILLIVTRNSSLA